MAENGGNRQHLLTLAGAYTHLNRELGVILRERLFGRKLREIYRDKPLRLTLPCTTILGISTTKKLLAFFVLRALVDRQLPVEQYENYKLRDFRKDSFLLRELCAYLRGMGEVIVEDYQDPSHSMFERT